MRTVQANDDAGSEPSSWSLAAPLKEMTSPTFQVVVESGAEMEAWGAVSPGQIVSVSVLDAPWESVTLNRKVTFALCVYVYVGEGTAESSNEPSPSRSQAYESVSPASGSDELLPSKVTVRGSGPLVGLTRSALAAFLASRLSARPFFLSEVLFYE